MDLTVATQVGISLAKATNNTMASQVAIIGTLLAVTMNTIVKVGMTAIIGGKMLAYWCGEILFSSLALSLIILIVNISVISYQLSVINNKVTMIND